MAHQVAEHTCDHDAKESTRFSCPGNHQATEFEREQVPEESRKGWLSFLAVFAGRHTAGTEFSIGPLFIVHGATARDVLLGLFVGNILATLTWRFIVAPIAVTKRYTTYYHLEQICGRKLLIPYNVFVGIAMSMLAGAMFTVSASAFGVMFKVDMPGLYDWLPTSWAWVALVAAVGVVTAFIAAFGYGLVTFASKLLTPYMLAVILFMGIQSLREFDVQSLNDFWKVANEKVWTGHAEAGYSKFGLWHCICAAWFCDLMLHIGMLDLTILRYAKSASDGWCAAAGMFLGHYCTWIIAALLYALQLHRNPEDTAVAPGPMANAVAGVNGLLCVIVAGWSTANPIMYAAGLAFQALLGPNYGTRRVTLGVGVIAIFAGLFPALVMRILELLAIAGLTIMPMGVVIICDFHLVPLLGLDLAAEKEETMKTSECVSTNWPAAATWLVTNIVMLPLALTSTVEVFFAPLPGIALATALYIGGTYVSKRSGGQEIGDSAKLPDETSSETTLP